MVDFRVWIQLIRPEIAALYRIRMYNISKKSMNKYSSTSLFSNCIVLLLCSHLLFRKNIIRTFEIRTITLNHFAERLCLNLVNELIESIPVNEKSFFWRMSVEVKIKQYIVKGLKIFSKEKYRWAFIFINSYCFFLVQSL